MLFGAPSPWSILRIDNLNRSRDYQPGRRSRQGFRLRENTWHALASCTTSRIERIRGAGYMRNSQHEIVVYSPYCPTSAFATQHPTVPTTVVLWRSLEGKVRTSEKSVQSGTQQSHRCCTRPKTEDAAQGRGGRAAASPSPGVSQQQVGVFRSEMEEIIGEEDKAAQQGRPDGGCATRSLDFRGLNLLG